MKKLTTEEAAAYLGGRDNILITTHLRPDGDTLGSAGALCEGLCRFGKTAYVLPNPQATSTFSDCIDPYSPPQGFSPDCVVTVDTASANLFPVNMGGYAGRVDLRIDHHPGDDGYAELVCLELTSSCGELVLEINKALNGGITPREAEFLYIAVSTDTGCFRYSNINDRTFECAAELFRAGAPCAKINKRIFRTKSLGRLKLESEMISGMRVSHGGRVGVAFITPEMVQREEDADDIASVPGQVEGVQVGITLRQCVDGYVKISARTTPDVSAKDLCERFGGGGHIAASGATVQGALDEVYDMLMKALDEILA